MEIGDIVAFDRRSEFLDNGFVEVFRNPIQPRTQVFLRQVARRELGTGDRRRRN